MPIENEKKYVLDDPAQGLERFLENSQDVPGYRILQSYIADDTRIRRFTPLAGGEPFFEFSFKRKVRGEQVEIEVAMSADDYGRLLPQSILSFVKHRFKLAEGNVKWDIDFLKTKLPRTKGMSTYFALAEAEMPRGMLRPERLPGFVQAHLLHSVGDGSGFGARRLAHVPTARKLLAELRARARKLECEPSLDPDMYDLTYRPMGLAA